MVNLSEEDFAVCTAELVLKLEIVLEMDVEIDDRLVVEK